PPGERLAVSGERRARLEPAFGKRPIAVVVEKVWLHAVVGDEDVHKPVVVIVGECHAQSAPLLDGDAGLLDDVLEGAIAAIAIKKICRGRKFGGRAIGSPSPAASLAMFGVPFHVAGHKKIEMAVVIVVEEARGNRPASSCNACFCGYVRERSVAIVVVQNIFSVVGYEKIGKTVVVIVGDSHAHAVIAEARVGQTGCFGYVCETAVFVLAIEPVPVAGVGAIEFLRHLHGACQTAAIDQKYVQKTVVIVVEQGDASRHGLDEVFLGSRRILQIEVQPAREFQIKNWSGSKSRETEEVPAVDS